MTNILWVLTILATLPSQAGQLIHEASLGDDTQWVLGIGTQCLEGKDGRLFLLDPGAFQVVILDAQFNEVGRLGRRGKGPGEFEEPKTMAFTPQGELAVFDPTLRRMTVFDSHGAVADTQRLDVSSVAIYQPTFLENGQLAFLSARAHEGKPVYDISLFNSQMELQHTLDRLYSKSMDWTQTANPRFWVDFLKNEMEMAARGTPLVCSPDGRTLVIARTDAYVLQRFTGDGQPLPSVKRESAPLPFSEPLKMALFEDVWVRLSSDPFLGNNMPESVYRRAAAEAETPKALPILKALFPLGGGFGVLAQYHGLKREGVIDLFDPNGQYLRTFRYLGPAHYLWGTRHHLYTVGPDADERIVLNKFRLD